MCNFNFKKQGLIFLAVFIIILINGENGFTADICRDGLKELNGSQGIIQDKGGLWGYLEKSPSLQSQSLIGLQIDGKLQRLISIFENLCSEGKTPTPKLHGLILGLLGDTRMIFNRDGDRRKKEPFIKTLKELNKKIDNLLAKLPQ
ncbi:MAG: hypothetical protein CMH75_06325 [Nitrospina sp.]|nr:hypothetical protein [Nitrospina sp.]